LKSIHDYILKSIHSDILKSIHYDILKSIHCDILKSIHYILKSINSDILKGTDAARGQGEQNFPGSEIKLNRVDCGDAHHVSIYVYLLVMQGRAHGKRRRADCRRVVDA
jgi:hypothetical protein